MAYLLQLKLSGPSGILFSDPNGNYGSYSMAAKENGIYRIKFVNTDAYNSPGKKINFSILGGETEKCKNLDPSDTLLMGAIAAKQLDPVHEELKRLNAGLRQVSEEHEFLMDREFKHRSGINSFASQ